MKAIEIKNLTFELENRVLLKGITVDFEEREFTVIFGPNGAGKTTLLKVILGQLSPVSGSVKIFGRKVSESRGEIGYVPQGIIRKRAFPFSVVETVLMGRYGKIRFFNSPSKEDYSIAKDAIRTVGLEGFEDRNLSTLSGGELQRVFIARAIAIQPRILLLDEATSGVDIGAKESLYDLLGRLKSKMSVIFVTHDMSVVSRNVDKVVCLNKELISHGNPTEALNEEAIKCMYGHDVALMSHCHGPHIHVDKHDL